MVIIIIIDNNVFENIQYPEDKCVSMHSHSLAFDIFFNGNISS